MVQTSGTEADLKDQHSEEWTDVDGLLDMHLQGDVWPGPLPRDISCTLAVR